MVCDVNETKLEELHGEMLGYCSGMLDMLKEACNAVGHQKFPISIDIQDSTIREKIDLASTELERHKIIIQSEEAALPMAQMVFRYLLEDFCTYMEESIDCVARFKPQVAFTLARKPLIDDIFMLMFLLYDKKQALDFIYEDDSRKKDLGKQKEFDEFLCKECSEIIGEKTKDNFLFLLRHSEEFYSIKSVCDKASHIITSRKNIRTGAGELNFVFVDQEIMDFYTKRYCKIVPVVLIYITQIVGKLLEDLFDISVNNDLVLKLKNTFMELLVQAIEQDKE